MNVPPVMATWLLRHLVLGDRNEALEGDLLEEFQRRGSASWYWRQVLGAILGFSNLMRAGWIMVCTVVFAGVWVYGLYVITCLIAHSPRQMAFGNWLNHEPYGEAIWIAEGIVFYLAGPLFVYMALTGNLSLRAFTVGLVAGVLVIVALPFFQSQLNTPLTYFFAYARARHWNVVLWLRWWGVLQGSVPPGTGVIPLLAAMWAAALSKTKMSALDRGEAKPHASE